MGRRHAEQLALRTRGARLVAACSPLADERDWAGRELGVPALYDDFAALLRDPQVQAVAIVTPTTLHAEMTMAALEAGKHVFVEKPLALDVPTCDMNDPNGFFVRFAPTSGGIFLDCSVQDIDLARWMLGNPKAQRAFATGTIALHPGLAECGDVDNGLAIVEFEGGARAQFYASRTLAHGHETSTEVIGTAGSVSVGVGAHRDRVQSRDVAGVQRRVLVDFVERFAEAFQREMATFVAACQGRAAPPLTLSDATEATRIGVAITKSLRSRQVEAVV
jgi:myo-inositol 2-dehydrogenase/D-chiro-inositol 1-dehydrogenase